jgi:hypothetical protein
MILLDPYRFQSGGASNDFLTNLHSAWDFEEASGTLNDRTSTYTATNNGATYGATGIDGDCLDFDGGSDNAVMASAGVWKFMHDGSTWSFSTWLKCDTPTTGRQVIFSTNGGSSLNTGLVFLWDNLVSPSRDRMLYVEMTRGVNTQRVYQLLDNQFFPNDTSWHHFAVTHDGTTMRFYLDGSLANSASKSGFSFSTSDESERVIGNRSAGGFGFAGKIDATYFWEDRVLDDTEISDIYNSGSGLFYNDFG